jgi:hypothetical protein
MKKIIAILTIVGFLNMGCAAMSYKSGGPFTGHNIWTSIIISAVVAIGVGIYEITTKEGNTITVDCNNPVDEDKIKACKAIKEKTSTRRGQIGFD